MRKSILAVMVAALGSLLTNHVVAQGTAFTYQGRLNDGGQPATGNYDLTFSLYYTNASGVAVAGPVTNSATVVSNGSFTTAIDFGSTVFNGTNCWLEIGVRTNGSATAFATLSPRQPLTPVPYALYALTPSGTNGLNGLNGLNGTNGVNGINGTNGLNGTNGATGPAGPLLPDLALVDTNQTFTASNTFSGVLIATNATNVIYGSFTGNGGGLTNLNVSGSQITGVIPLAQLPASVVTNGASGVNFSGTFSGNGAGVTNVNLASANSQGAIVFATINGIFTLASSPPTGNGPISVVAADVNGDGKPDLISVNYNASTLTVLTNNGSGGFGSNATLTVGSGPQAVVAATNLYSHGEVDLICANFNDTSLTVFTNNGSSGFLFAATLPLGGPPVSVAVADVNGDGKLDLITANYSNPGTLTVLTNNGNGGFATDPTPGVGNGPESVAVADVNGDGKPDLITANINANTLTVLTNNGSGGFGSNATLNVGSSPRFVVAADVNGDGKPDLICANLSAGTLTVLTNNGSGGFGFNATLTVGSNPYAVVAADVNGDGRLDLVSVNNGNSTLTVFTNNGSGGFVFNATISLGSTPVSATSADVNGDGKVDLICANIGANTLTVLTNSSSGSINFTGNGSGLTALNPANLGAGTAGISITGNAATASTANSATTSTSFSGSLSGDVTGTQTATVVGTVGTSTAANVHSAELAANAAASANTASTIVKRDASGNFSAGTVTATAFSGDGSQLTGIAAAATPPVGMVLIPAGSFTMGDNLDGESDATPISITVSAIYMDVNLVSYSQWKSVYYWATNQAGYGFADAGAGKAANNPVQTLDWFDCVKWCNARSQQAGRTPVYYTDAGYTHIYTNLESYTVYVNPAANGYRLPTEAEWEKAARGGLSGQRFPWGNNIDESLANYYGATASYTYDLGPNGYNAIGSVGSTSPATSPVGSFAPNGYGLFDMAGNVLEWCGDWYGTPYGQPTATNPTGPTTGSYRVLRGGYFYYLAYYARCANRNFNYPNFANNYFGFRCVRGL